MFFSSSTGLGLACLPFFVYAQESVRNYYVTVNGQVQSIQIPVPPVVTKTVQVVNAAHTEYITTAIAESVVTTTIVLTAPVPEISSIAQGIPSSIRVPEASGPVGPVIPISVNGYSTRITLPATAIIPSTQTALPPITPIILPNPVNSASQAAVSKSAAVGSKASAVSESAASIKSAAGSAVSSTASQVSPPVVVPIVPNASSAVESAVASASSAVESAATRASSAVEGAASKASGAAATASVKASQAVSSASSKVAAASSSVAGAASSASTKVTGAAASASSKVSGALASAPSAISAASASASSAIASESTALAGAKSSLTSVPTSILTATSTLDTAAASSTGSSSSSAAATTVAPSSTAPPPPSSSTAAPGNAASSDRATQTGLVSLVAMVAGLFFI